MSLRLRQIKIHIHCGEASFIMYILGYLAFIKIFRIFNMFNMAAFQENPHDLAQIVLTWGM